MDNLDKILKIVFKEEWLWWHGLVVCMAMGANNLPLVLLGLYLHISENLEDE